jgi:2-iminoacetate synthase
MTKNKSEQNAQAKQYIDFIDEPYLNHQLQGPHPEPHQVREVIARALEKKPLTIEETALLVRTTQPELVEEIFAAARNLKKTVYGNRIVLFAPLYIGNYCVNDCQYCGFRRSNPDAVRRTLSQDEVVNQVKALEDKGHKRLILVFGEHPVYGAKYIADTVKKVYATTSGHGEIRRVNINAAPLDVEDYKIVKEAGIGTYQVFQETYHRATYSQYHPKNTPKGDYDYRLHGLSRAFEAGIDDMGIGVLFGLYDWRFEVLAMVQHALFLQDVYGVGPHTVSFPRLKEASGVTMDDRYLVSDDEFKRIIAILRLAIPYTGLILTARENADIRRTCMSFGVSQIDAGSRIELGGYTEAGDAQVQVTEKEQFQLGDLRTLDDVMRELLEDGYIPSFCTACYRIGRTGEHFMEFAVPGFIKRYCTPNGLMTLMEYLVDYASPKTRAAGLALIKKELDQMEESDMKTKLIQRLEKIESDDDRDFYF